MPSSTICAGREHDAALRARETGGDPDPFVHVCVHTISLRILGFEARNYFSPALMLSFIVATYHTAISPTIAMHEQNCNNLNTTYNTTQTHQSVPMPLLSS